MSITRRVKRLLGVSMAGAMVLALMPAGIAAADMHLIDTDDVAACDLEGFETPEFDDVLGFFADEIECMASYDITVGDAEGNFNSPGTVTRQQMALFIARLASQALNGNITDIPEAADDAFDDIATVNPPEARDAINWLAELEITVGAEGGESYNPSGSVTRQQMASFVARAHDALGVDFSGIEVDDARFTDVDADNVHLDNINLLAAAGVVRGTGDGTTYSPTALVSRGQMSAFVVRSIGVLESQDLWNGVPTVDPIVAELTILEADGGEVLLSDGAELSIVTYDATRDDFFIDGDAASATAFLGEVDPGDQLEFSGNETDGFEHNLINVDVTAGVVGEVDLAGNGFVITDFPSGITISQTFDYDGLLFTVDGAAASQVSFEDDLSVGDLIEVTVDAEGDEVSFALTNNAPSGDVIGVDAGEIIVDVLGDADFEVVAAPAAIDEIPGHRFDEVDAVDEYELTVNGDDVAIADFAELRNAVDGLLDDVTAGDIENVVASYGRVDATVSVVVTYDEIPAPEFAAFTGVVIDDGGAGNLRVAVDADTLVDVTFAADASYQVDGLITVDFGTDASFGDEFACQAGTLDETDPVATEVTCSDNRLTNVETVSAQVTGVSTATGEITVELDNGYVATTTPNVLGVTLDATPVLIDGDDTVAITGETDPVAVTVALVLNALEETNLDVVTVTTTLTHDDGADGVWNFVGIPQSALDDANAAL